MGHGWVPRSGRPWVWRDPRPAFQRHTGLPRESRGVQERTLNGEEGRPGDYTASIADGFSRKRSSVRKSVDCGCGFGFGSLDPRRDIRYRSFSLSKDMDPNAARTAMESLDLAFHERSGHKARLPHPLCG
jgi:hypothetical protein